MPRPIRLQWKAWLSGFALILCSMYSLSAQAETTSQVAPLESRVRAAFLYNFARFTEWPNSNQSDQVLEFCINGNDALATNLSRTVADKMINGLKPQVRTIGSTEELANCDLLYLPKLSQTEKQTWLASLNGQSILSVGEGRHFAQTEGMIGFHLVERRLRFAINPRRVHDSGLQMSSRLLGLADIVTETP